MEKSKVLDLIHAKTHGLRMIPKYKATKFEQEINKLILETYQIECIECREKLEISNLREQLEKKEGKTSNSNPLAKLLGMD
jgi:hypothetical protein